MSRRLLNLKGCRFGRLTAIRRAPNSANGRARWVCQCSCKDQTIVTVFQGSLRAGHTKSCGCIQREIVRRRICKLNKHQHGLNSPRHKHGFSRSGKQKQVPEYKAWTSMFERCSNPRTPSYKNYGAIGVSVCRRWRRKHGFQHFLACVGSKPTPKNLYSLGRFLDSGNYEPGNCCWMTRAEQEAERKGRRAMMALRKFHSTLNLPKRRKRGQREKANADRGAGRNGEQNCTLFSHGVSR